MLDDDKEKENWDNTDFNIEDNDDSDNAISWDDLLSEDGDSVIDEHVSKQGINSIDAEADDDDLVINLDDESSLNNLDSWAAESETPVVETNKQVQSQDVLDLYDETDNGIEVLNESGEVVDSIPTASVEDIASLQTQDDDDDIKIKVNEIETQDAQDNNLKSKFLNLYQDGSKSLIPTIAGLVLAIVIVGSALFIYTKMSSKDDIAAPSTNEVITDNAANSPDAPISEDSMQEYSPDALNATLQQKKEEKFIVDIVSTGRANPFTPAGNVSIAGYTIPSAVDIVAPPETISDDTSLSGLVEIQVSGILYDNQKPSAIITVGGVDHFVQRGDTVDKYIVTEISPTYVVIRNGKNIFRASIGQNFNVNDGIAGQTKYVYNKNKTYTRQYFTPVTDDTTASGQTDQQIARPQIQ